MRSMVVMYTIVIARACSSEEKEILFFCGSTKGGEDFLPQTGKGVLEYDVVLTVQLVEDETEGLQR